jgi:TolB-like protein
VRKALAADPETERLIVTIARKGYQFTSTVTVADEASSTRQPAIEAPAQEDSPTQAPSRWWKTPLIIGPAIVLVLASFIAWRSRVSVPATAHRVMLAVLPFQNLTGDPGKEYLADGLTEEMISQLGRLAPEQLGVIARTSVMGYKRTDKRLDQIGRDLSVEYVLESSLRESGNHVRLTAQLIHVQDQTHIWSNDYDYQSTDILHVEDDVADAVTQEIRVRLTSHQPTSGASSPAKKEAFDAYLKGFYHFQRNTNADTEMALKYYERATQIDPSYALAWAGLARVRHWQANIGLLPKEEGQRLARQAVERALALNGSLAAAHIEMGRIQKLDDFDWVGADASYQRAMAVEPGNAEAVRMAAFSAQDLGRFDEALQLGRWAAAMDPVSPESPETLAEIELCVGQFEQAAMHARKALELSPDVWPGHILLSKILLMGGRPQEALPEIEKVRYEAFRPALNSMAYYALGRRNDSDAALREFISKNPGYPYEAARIYAFRDQSDEAFQALDRAYLQRDNNLAAAKVDPFLKSLHDDPRFAALLKKLNFPN